MEKDVLAWEGARGAVQVSHANLDLIRLRGKRGRAGLGISQRVRRAVGGDERGGALSRVAACLESGLASRNSVIKSFSAHAAAPSVGYHSNVCALRVLYARCCPVLDGN